MKKSLILLLFFIAVCQFGKAQNNYSGLPSIVSSAVQSNYQSYEVMKATEYTKNDFFGIVLKKGDVYVEVRVGDDGKILDEKEICYKGCSKHCKGHYKKKKKPKKHHHDKHHHDHKKKKKKKKGHHHDCCKNHEHEKSNDDSIKIVFEKKL
ncbi:hypothetical protein [Aureibacter tunicatorum]|uniref:Uncharacterized protein n=1 Tax=Aureibacter tunicatorum TaxID=866807 RepID=A0AAE4BUH0_9BACT|nr:hypothetical protein [Aureibacter tunicatorum]MDR6240747.1 hypothetical protein [Aureibacter tunicatorum]BDD06920.1 hypothetical protein AUTU_44030 [Aureibacter tunicatorum]